MLPSFAEALPSSLQSLLCNKPALAQIGKDSGANSANTGQEEGLEMER
jgi:hypothetical protein